MEPQIHLLLGDSPFSGVPGQGHLGLGRTVTPLIPAQLIVERTVATHSRAQPGVSIQRVPTLNGRDEVTLSLEAVAIRYRPEERK